MVGFRPVCFQAFLERKIATDVSLPYPWAMKSRIEEGFRVYSNSTKVIWLAG